VLPISRSRKLEKANLTAYVLNANTLTDIIKAVSQLGAVFNVKSKADKLVSELRNKMTEIGQRTSKFHWRAGPQCFSQ